MVFFDERGFPSVSPLHGSPTTRLPHYPGAAMSEYRVERVQQSGGRWFAVVYQGQYMFLQKTQEGAERIADKMNKIRKRRIEAMG